MTDRGVEVVVADRVTVVRCLGPWRGWLPYAPEPALPAPRSVDEAAAATRWLTLRSATVAHAPQRHGVTFSARMARTLEARLRSEVAGSGIPGRASAAIVFPDGREWTGVAGAAVVHSARPMDVADVDHLRQREREVTGTPRELTAAAD